MTFFQLISRFGCTAAAIEALPKISKRHARETIPSRQAIEKEFASLSAIGANFVCAVEPHYPALLRQLDPPPPVITYLGHLKLAHQRCVAIVGSRQASAAGRAVARKLALELAEKGFTIVSGLARGIDGEAHAASLKTGTIAVLAGGIDHIYPPQHAQLYRAISENGLLISECVHGYRATARDFPRRNRVVTGLSEGVVVIEAAERSGSLISARSALEQNREVMAVPGSPLDPRCTGTNKLLRDGAVLVRDAQDVIEALSKPLPRRIEAPPGSCFDSGNVPTEPISCDQIDAVKSALTSVPVKIDDIARAANVGAHRCAAILVELELGGIAVTHPGGLASLNLEQETQ